MYRVAPFLSSEIQCSKLTNSKDFGTILFILKKGVDWLLQANESFKIKFHVN